MANETILPKVETEIPEIPETTLIDKVTLSSYLGQIIESRAKADKLIEKYFGNLSVQDNNFLYDEVLNDSDMHYIYVMELLGHESDDKLKAKLAEVRTILAEESPSGYKRISTYLLLLDKLDN